MFFKFNSMIEFQFYNHFVTFAMVTIVKQILFHSRERKLNTYENTNDLRIYTPKIITGKWEYCKHSSRITDYCIHAVNGLCGEIYLNSDSLDIVKN